MQSETINFEEISINSSDTDKSGNDFDKFLDFKVQQNLSMVGLQNAISSFGTPTSKYSVAKKVNARLVFETEYYTNCPKCGACFQVSTPLKGKKTCGNCDNDMLISEANYFVYIPLKQQIVLNVKHYFKSIIDYQNKLNAENSDDLMTDVYQGKIYKRISEKISKDKIILSLTLNADGAKVFNRNTEAVWPLQLYQNYLPPKLRYLTKNILVVGVYYGKSSQISFQNFLYPLVQELRELENGFNIEDKNFSISVVPKLVHAVADLPAKAKMQEFVQFNAYNACGYCHQHGMAMPNVSRKGKTVRYLLENPPAEPKLHENIVRIMEQLKDGEQKSGVKDISALTYINDFDIILSFGIDDLHAIYEGVFSKILDLLLNARYHKSDFHLTVRKQQLLDSRITNIKPTMDITRKPRSLIANRNYLKGSEKRNLLLFYLIPCLDGVLRRTYTY